MQLNQLKLILSRSGIKPNKRLGQNFLLSEEVLDQIVAAADLREADTVLEIGPGLGFLTKRLADAAGAVVAIEKDRKLCQALQKMFKNKKNVKIVCGDALWEVPLFVRRGRGGLGESTMTPLTSPLMRGERRGESLKVVANIPYYLTGKILEMLLANANNTNGDANIANAPSPYPLPLVRGRGGNLKVSVTSQNNVAEVFRPPSLIVLLLQKEVAERIVAGPGEMSILAVSVQLYSDPEIISYVGRENFYPAPEVDSAIVRLTPPPSPPIPAAGGAGGELKGGFRPRFAINDKKFMQLVKIGFSNKRKQLKNNLMSLPTSYQLPATSYSELLQSLGLNPLARAQDLSLADWVRLYRKLQI